MIYEVSRSATHVSVVSHTALLAFKKLATSGIVNYSGGHANLHQFLDCIFAFNRVVEKWVLTFCHMHSFIKKKVA